MTNCGDFDDYCGYKLPCGFCRLMMQPCPKNSGKVVWTGSPSAYAAGSATPEQGSTASDIKEN